MAWLFSCRNAVHWKSILPSCPVCVRIHVCFERLDGRSENAKVSMKNCKFAAQKQKKGLDTICKKKKNQPLFIYQDGWVV